MNGVGLSLSLFSFFFLSLLCGKHWKKKKEENYPLHEEPIWEHKALSSKMELNPERSDFVFGRQAWTGAYHQRLA